MASFVHRGNRAVVSFQEDLTWEAAIELADILEILAATYFYRRIDLVIGSSGGLIAALHYWLAQAGRHRAQGVRLRGRVISEVASAGALMFSLADERVVEPGARLLFHCARSAPSGPVTASGCAFMYGELSCLDGDMVGMLADRALADPNAVGPVRAESSDRPVLERLLGSDMVGGAKRPPSVRALARALDRKVTSALRAGDRRALIRLYGELFDMDHWISASLARVLRLADHVGLPARQVATLAPGRPGLTIPGWAVLFPPSGQIPREVLLRHALLMGETGSGKTLSGILPVAAACARAPRDVLSAALVVDPKRELGPVLQRLAPDRFDPILSSSLVLDLMALPEWSVSGDLAAGRWQSAAARILVRAVSFVPTMAARVLVDHNDTNGTAEFFEREGTNLLLTVLAVVLMVTRADAPSPDEWLADDPEARAWARELLARAKGSDVAPGPNALALAAGVLDGPLTRLPPARTFVVSLDEGPVPAQEWLFARVARRARAVWGAGPGDGRDLLGRVVDYWLPMVSIDRQYAGVWATARSACAEFADPAVSTRLYFGCEPGFAAARDAGRVCDFAAAVGRDGGGRLMVFQPALSGGGTLLAKALKASFFESIFSDPDRLAGSPDVPLAAYIADECHRFVTSDRTHGEQSFLDTCRSFQAFCFLACQSVSSLDHALAHGCGGGAQDSAAVSVLWNNTGSKLFFRSTDPQTAGRVSDLAPCRPGLTAVTRVRPLSTLAPGECYAAMADGRFGRWQLEPFTEAEPVEDSVECATRPKRGHRARGAGEGRPARAGR